MPKPVNPIVQYSISIALEFKARMDRMRNFVEHNLSSGIANETILREFLSQHAPGKYHVGQGFIFDPADPRPIHLVSRQCDVLVYDQNSYPTVYSNGAVKVVFPDSVVMVIEVKTNLSSNKGADEVKNALGNIMAAKQMRKYMPGVIFAFQSPKLETVIKHLQSCPPIEPWLSPVAILLFDRGIIIHCWDPEIGIRPDYSTQPGRYPVYKIVKGKQDECAIVIAFLLLLFLETVSAPQRGHFAVALSALLNYWTDEYHPDMSIGHV
jgi:hypothetical protein